VLGDRADVSGIAKIAVKQGEVFRQGKGFVNDRAGRAGDDVEIGDSGGDGRAFGGAAREHQFALEGVAVQPRRLANQQLRDLGAGFGGDPAEHGGVDRNLAPPDDRERARIERGFGQRPRRRGKRRVARQERHRHAVITGLQFCRAEAGEIGGQHRVRNLGQHARAVAGAGIGPDAAAVGQVDQPAQRAFDDLARRTALDVDHQTDAAGVMLQGGVIHRGVESCAVGKRLRVRHLANPSYQWRDDRTIFSLRRKP
jgi:hypothetical protein